MFQKQKLADKVLQFVNLIMEGRVLWLMLSIWIAPGINDGKRLYSLCILAAFDFFMIHSGVAMAVMKNKVAGVILFVILYLPFALVFNSFVDDYKILNLYCTVVLSRMRFAFYKIPDEARERQIRISATAALSYFASLSICVINSDTIPRFGLTDQYLSLSGYKSNVKIGGLFTESPQVAIATATLNYSFLLMIQIGIFIRSLFRK